MKMGAGTNMKQTKTQKVLKHLFVLSIGIIMIYPVLWMVSSSLKPEYLIFSDPVLWPKELTFENYIKGWHAVKDTTFGLFFKNSFVISIIAVIGNVVTCSMAAYAFARMKFPLKSVLFALMIFTIMLPTHVTLVPQYVIFHKLEWINTILPLTVPKMLAVDGFFIFLLVQFFRGIPRELDESATMDGCGPFRIYTHIILPLALPALLTTAIFTFMWTWDDFFSQILYLNTVDNFTVPLGLRLFLDAEGQSSWGVLFAMSVLALTPIMTIFFFLQKQIVESIASTGVKG